MRTYAYIDGFNLFYGALRRTPYRWLDVKSLLTLLLRPYNQILKIKYFLARVKPTQEDPSKHSRQQTLIRALEAHIPEIEFLYGHFRTDKVPARLATPISGQRTAQIIKTQEKGSDVNLAVHLLNDAWLDLYDCAVLVSNDSDLSEAVRLVTHQRRKTVGIIAPQKSDTSWRLNEHAKFVIPIRTWVLEAAQLPDPIPNDPNIRKPRNW